MGNQAIGSDKKPASATTNPNHDQEVVTALQSRVEALEKKAPVPGPRGEAGPKGDTGPVGPMGAKGDTGPKGDTGLAGAQGSHGLDGRDGRDGQDLTPPPAAAPKQTFYQKNWAEATAGRKAATAGVVVATVAATTVAVVYGVKYYKGRRQAALPEVTVGM